MNGQLNALNPVLDINSYAEYFTNHGYKIRPELFYDKQLLDTIRLDADQFTFYRLAKPSPIQNGAEKLQLRRWAPLQAHTVPLAEGVPPFSDKGSMESYEIETAAYGRYMEFTDRVDFEFIDPVIAHYVKEYSIVAMETLDLLARETLETVAQSAYANGKADFSELEIGDVGTIEDLRVITLSLLKQLVKPRNGSRFMVISNPDFYFDMINDPLVENYMKYNNTTKGFYDDMGPIPPMFNLEFYETMFINDSGEFIDETGEHLLVYSVNENTGAITYDVLDAATSKIAATDNYVRDERTGERASYVPGLMTWDIPEGFQELKVSRTFVLGADCLTRTEIAGQGNVKTYVKPLGSAGVLDPIDQRQSIGFKINSVGFGSTRTEAVVIYYSVPTQANLI